MVISYGKQLLTTSEAAELLHYHVNTIRRLSDRGTLRSFRLGLRGDRRYSLQDVLRLSGELNAGK